MHCRDPGSGADKPIRKERPAGLERRHPPQSEPLGVVPPDGDLTLRTENETYACANMHAYSTMRKYVPSSASLSTVYTETTALRCYRAEGTARTFRGEA